jgi:replicative DNA helicase Mcm
MTQLSVQDSVLLAKWEQFLKAYCQEAVQEAAEAYPDVRSVLVQFNDIQLADMDLADYLLHQPRHCLQIGAQALQLVDVTVDPKPRLHLRVAGLPPSQLVPIRNVRVDHLGRFLALEGLVKKTTPVRPMVLEAAWDCKTCGNRLRVIQDEEFLTEPVYCDGCEKAGPWKLREEESRFVDHQKLELQESPEGLRGGAQAEKIVVHVQDDLAGQLLPGDRVRINAILTAQERRENQKRRVEFEKVLQAVSLEVQQKTFEEIQLTPDDEEACQELARRPDLWAYLHGRFATPIKGLDDEKDGLLLSLFGAPSVERGLLRERGEIHVLLAGDPGLAKTKLLRHAAQLAPLAVRANGKTSSGVGLTSAAVKDDFGGSSGWSLEAGAAVLADMGLLALDELDKLPEGDQASLLEVMEEGQNTVNKANISQVLRARCTLQAAANPKDGHFDPFNGRIFDQLNMRPELLSRFDLAFALRDKPDPVKDLELLRHAASTMDGDVEDLVDDEDVAQLRKYIAYAKRVKPVLGVDLREQLVQFVAEARRRGKEGAPAMNARQLNSLMRLAKASARAHLRNQAVQEDVDRAVALFKASWRSLGALDDSGAFDADVLTTGLQKDQRTRLAIVLELVRDQAINGVAEEDHVVEAATKRGLTLEQARKAIEQLRRDGSVYQKGGPGQLAAMRT